MLIYHEQEDITKIPTSNKEDIDVIAGMIRIR